jgi:hypothetical protein
MNDSDHQQSEPIDVAVLVVYEDLPAGLRAKKFLDRLAKNSDIGAVLNTTLWRADLLGLPLLQEQAAVEAAAVDLILLTVNGQTDLSAPVRQWMSRWLDHKEDRSYALGVLFNSPSTAIASRSSVIAFVQQIADAAEADFFFNTVDADADTADVIKGLSFNHTDRSVPFPQALSNPETDHLLLRSREQTR